MDMSNALDISVSQFQSPRSGKFVSDLHLKRILDQQQLVSFNPLDRGNLYQIFSWKVKRKFAMPMEFQSPRSGKFVSDSVNHEVGDIPCFCFNPLDRGNLYLIQKLTHKLRQKSQSEVSIPQIGEICIRFEIFDCVKSTLSQLVSIPQIGEICIRCNFYQTSKPLDIEFQSPRSGKFVSNQAQKGLTLNYFVTFQSPRSGKFVSDGFLKQQGQPQSL